MHCAYFYFAILNFMSNQLSMKTENFQYLIAIQVQCFILLMSLFCGSFHAGYEAEFAGDLKRAIKIIRKSLGDRYLLIPLPDEEHIVSSLQGF